MTGSVWSSSLVQRGFERRADGNHINATRTVALRLSQPNMRAVVG